jgi:hypothetical protein
MTAGAQELSKIGQTNLKMFNNSIAKLGSLTPGKPTYEMEIKNAEKKLELLKKSDPGYNTASLEAELQSYKDKNGSAENKWAKGEPQQTSTMDMEKFNELLVAGTKEYSDVKDVSELNKLKQMVDAYETKVAAFASENGDQSSNDNAKRSAEDGWNTYLDDYTTVFYAKKNAERSENALNSQALYYHVKLVKCKWDAMLKMFPESDIVKEASEKSNEALNAIGSPEALASKAEKTKAETIASTRMNPAVVNDPSFEAEIKKALAASKVAAGKNVIKINILSSEWSIKRHAISGVILSRTKAFEAVWKEADGTCTLLYYSNLKQDYDGSKYGKSYVYTMIGTTRTILCENVK